MKELNFNSERFLGFFDRDILGFERHRCLDCSEVFWTTEADAANGAICDNCRYNKDKSDYSNLLA